MSLIVFLVLTIGGGLLVGFATRPGEWYVKLSKPWFMPLNSVFAPVWTLLYVMIAIAGWRTFMRDPLGATMILWAIALALNFIWSPIFFRLHRPAAALLVILALLAMIIAFIALSWPEDALSALLFAPYAAWVVFATILNASIWRLNG
jgi:tryptophan-rich sensory protein